MPQSRKNHRSAFGSLLRHWRGLRGKSQLALASDCGMSARHLSFIETGRSRPGKRLIQRLADALNVPARQRDTLLRAAGLSVPLRAESLEAKALGPYRDMVRRMLRQHEPYPAFAIDGRWNVVAANDSARRANPALARTGVNAMEIFMAEEGPRIANRQEVGRNLLARLRREAARLGDDAYLSQLEQRLHRCIACVPDEEENESPVIVYRFDVAGRVISTVGAIVQFDTAHEAALDELRIELHFPADTESDVFFTGTSPQRHRKRAR